MKTVRLIVKITDEDDLDNLLNQMVKYCDDVEVSEVYED